MIFYLDDQCTFEELLYELKDKLENSHQGILTGPLMRVTIHTGYRQLTLSQQKRMKEIFKAKGNLFIKSIENEMDLLKKKEKDQVQLVTGTIRSGQVQEYNGNILFIGDVNPGGHLTATGSIFILGTLRGIAHAGKNGEEDSIIAASVMDPTQLRIADFISYPPDKKDRNVITHKFAFVKDKQIQLEELSQLSNIRNGLGIFI